MGASTINLPATLQPDGVTLRLEEKSSLPPGRVSVTIQPTEPAIGPTMLEVLERIHREQRESGRQPMSEEEMAVAIGMLRDDDAYEERWREIWSNLNSSKQAGQ